MSARTFVKHLAEPVLESLVAPLSRAMHRGRTLVLAYHNVVPDGHAPLGERSLHLPQRVFGAQLDALCASHDVVPLDALLDPPRGRRPRAVLTFDDAYRGALTAGLEELRSRSLPATVCVAPGLLGDQSTWWDTYADPATGALDAAFRTQALGPCGGRLDDVRAAAARSGRLATPMPPWARTGAEDDLARAVAAGMTVAAHSWSHANLAVVSGPALVREVQEPLDWLRARFPAATVGWFAYPYGLSSPAVEAAVRTAGYRGALLVSGGYLPRALPPTERLPRLNVAAGLSRAGFVLRTAGVMVR